MKTKLNQSKLKLAIVSAMLLGTAGLTLPAYAATLATGSLDVTAQVSASCTVSTTDLAFGEYLYSADASDSNTSGLIKSNCTIGSGGIIKLSDGDNATGGVRRMVHFSDATKFLRYSVSNVESGGTKWDDTTGVGYAGTGNPVNSIAYGQIEANQSDAIVGTYTDTLVVTVTY
jgi:spore coat protein U-like protein